MKYNVVAYSGKEKVYSAKSISLSNVKEMVKGSSFTMVIEAIQPSGFVMKEPELTDEMKIEVQNLRERSMKRHDVGLRRLNDKSNWLSEDIRDQCSTLQIEPSDDWLTRLIKRFMLK